MSKPAPETASRRRVIGIDPGTQTLGYGVVDVFGNRVEAVEFGALKLTGSHPERLHCIHSELRTAIERLTPQCFAIEEVYQGRSFQSILKLGQARGVALLVAQQHRLAISEFTPAEVKKTVTGNGRADKVQVQRMVARLLRLDQLPEPTDVTDALAVAYCCAEELGRAMRLGLTTHQNHPTSALRQTTKRIAKTKSAKQRAKVYGANRRENSFYTDLVRRGKAHWVDGSPNSGENSEGHSRPRKQHTNEDP